LVFAIVSLASGCTHADADPSSTVASFSRLPEADELLVQLVLDGCWGDSAFELVFRRDREPSVAAVRLNGDWSTESEQFTELSRGRAYEARLSEADIQGLDRLLNFYRAGVGEGCSDTHFVTITQVHSGRVLAKEHFVDRACGPDEESGVTTLWDLIDRLDIPQ